MVMKSRAIKRLLALKLTWEKRRNINHVAQFKKHKIQCCKDKYRSNLLNIIRVKFQLKDYQIRLTKKHLKQKIIETAYYTNTF